MEKWKLGTDHLTWRAGLWFFVSFRNFFSDNTRVRTLNQIIIFFLHQNQKKNFSNIGNQNIFLEKNHSPPFKLNCRSLSIWHINKSSLGPSNSDGSNTMDGSNLFESPANFPYIVKIKKIFRSNTDPSK
jgi:hypothetical protein